MNDDTTTKDRIIFGILMLSSIVNTYYIYITKDYGWILYVMVPIFLVSVFIRNYFIQYIFDSYAMSWELLGAAFCAFTSSPVSALIMVYAAVTYTEWYINCKGRGYFVPTKANQKKHVMRKLKGGS